VGVTTGGVSDGAGVGVGTGAGVGAVEPRGLEVGRGVLLGPAVGGGVRAGGNVASGRPGDAPTVGVALASTVVAGDACSLAASEGIALAVAAG
jgi:hypothetical protein